MARAAGGNANNNPAVPAAAPMDNDPCTAAGRCWPKWPDLQLFERHGMTTNCDCQRGNVQRDGGRAPSAWQCTTRNITVRDAGVVPPRDGGFNGFDAAVAACPAGTMNNGSVHDGERNSATTASKTASAAARRTIARGAASK